MSPPQQSSAGPWFDCNRAALASGELRHPGYAQAAIPVRLRRVGRQKLELIATSSAEAMPCGALAHLELSLPDVGLVKTQVRVLRARPVSTCASGMPRLRIEARVENPAPRLMAALGQYLLWHGHAARVSPQALRLAGLSFTHLDPCLQFGEARSSQQMAQVLSLRYRVFAEAQILKPNQHDEADLWDSRDDEASIMVAAYKGRVVGTCRAYLCHAKSALEFDAWGAQSELLPPRAQLVEMSRAALEPAFRGTDIPAILFRRCVALAVRTGRRYMVLGTYKERLPYYRHFGFLPTGITFAYPGAPNDHGQVLMADLQTIWRGEQGGPLLWQRLFADLDEDLAHGPYMPVSWPHVAKIAAMRRLQPMCQRLTHWYMNHRYRP